MARFFKVEVQDALDEKEEANMAASYATLKLVSNHDMKPGKALQAGAEKLEIPDHLREAPRQRLFRLCNLTRKVPRATLMTEECERLLLDLVAAFSVNANLLRGFEVRCLVQVDRRFEECPVNGLAQVPARF